MKIKVGDCVKVKKGIKDPDFENFLIENWQGNIIEIIEEYDDESIALVCIEWDSETLKKCANEYIRKCEIEGFDWKLINLFVNNLEITTSRDTEKNLKQIQKIISENNYWASFGEEGERIEKILKNVNPENEWKCFLAWKKYMEKNLKFPFDAIADFSVDNLNDKQDNKLIVKKISTVLDFYGVIAKGKINNQIIEFPIFDIEVADEKSKNFEIINDYQVWFSNREQ